MPPKPNFPTFYYGGEILVFGLGKQGVLEVWQLDPAGFAAAQGVRSVANTRNKGHNNLKESVPPEQGRTLFVFQTE